MFVWISFQIWSSMPFQIHITSTTYKMSFKTQDKCLTNEGLKEFQWKLWILQQEKKRFRNSIQEPFLSEIWLEWNSLRINQLPHTRLCPFFTCNPLSHWPHKIHHKWNTDLSETLWPESFGLLPMVRTLCTQFLENNIPDSASTQFPDN